ncbi:MAG: DUF2330 domain-containing protein [Deltaproteobacteria bacterium]|nr:DUF2330 domain-containing protein [Deltaproteobacteria bacterium]
MRTTALVAAFALASLLAPRAWPCGAPFAKEQIEIEPSQQIAIAYRDGIETYVFSPHFCGKATEFGLILPIPGALSADPSLAPPELFTELDALTAPAVQEECEESESNGCLFLPGAGASDRALAAGAAVPPANQAVDVVDTGHVGQFDWVLLKADTAAAFTDWLDANGYPYDGEAVELFDHYVSKGWYFVAFRFSTSQQPPEGYRLCGALGPLSLSFPAEKAVIPSRIAAVGAQGELVWQIFTLGPSQTRTQVSGVGETLLYAGTLGAPELGAYPKTATFAKSGDRVTKLNLSFSANMLDDDIEIETNPSPADYRATEVLYVGECEGCSVASGRRVPRIPLIDIMLVAAALWLGRRTGCRQGR